MVVLVVVLVIIYALLGLLIFLQIKWWTVDKKNCRMFQIVELLAALGKPRFRLRRLPTKPSDNGTFGNDLQAGRSLTLGDYMGLQNQVSTTEGDCASMDFNLLVILIFSLSHTIL